MVQNTILIKIYSLLHCSVLCTAADGENSLASDEHPVSQSMKHITRSPNCRAEKDHLVQPTRLTGVALKPRDSGEHYRSLQSSTILP